MSATVDEEVLQEIIKTADCPAAASTAVGMTNNLLIADVEKQLPLFLRDWLLALYNWTQDDMQGFYGSLASKGYIQEKWQKYNQNLVGWVLDLDLAHMSKLARFFDKQK